MPAAWARLLMDSQISKQEQMNNPQAVLDALKYYTQGETGGQKWLQYMCESIWGYEGVEGQRWNGTGKLAAYLTVRYKKSDSLQTYFSPNKQTFYCEW